MIVEFLYFLYAKVKFYFPKTIQHREIPHRTLQQKCDKYMKSCRENWIFIHEIKRHMYI